MTFNNYSCQAEGKGDREMQGSVTYTGGTKNKQRFDFNDYFEFSMYLLAAICFVYFFVKGNTAKYLQPILIVAVLLVIRAVQKYSKIEFFPALRFTILAFIFITMFLAKEFDFYSIIPFLDKVEHLMSGVFLFFIGLLHFKQLNKNEDSVTLHSVPGIYYGLFFSVAMAGVWEIHEFTTDRLFGLASQNGSLIDTMTDIICGTIGAVGTCIFYRLRLRGK